MKDFLRAYVRRGLIREEKIGFDQVVKHFNRAKKDLLVAKTNLKIDSEAAYNYAYLAMLRTGRALMFCFGFRPTDGQQHKTVVDFCEHILGSDFLSLVRNFDHMRKKRNRFTYDEPGLLVTDTETNAAFANAVKFVEEIAKFIQQKNPQRKLL